MKKFKLEDTLKSALETKCAPEKSLNNKVLHTMLIRKSYLKNALKIAAACAASFLIIIAALANSSASIAYAMQDIPIVGEIAKLVTFRTYEDEAGGFNALIEIPEIEGYGNAAKEVNADMKAYGEELIKMYEIDKEASSGLGNYELTSTYKVLSNNKKYLTVQIDTLLVMAGGTQYVRYYTIDKEQDRVLKLSDLFEEGFDYKGYLYKEVRRQMEERMKNDTSLSYFSEEDGMFTEITDKTQFYINDKGNLVLSFDEYEVAPGFMGVQTFEISL